MDTNNSTELEGMIQGIQIIIKNGWMSEIVEGDSSILIQMVKQLANDNSTDKVSTSWRLARRLDELRTMVMMHLVLSFIHIRREENKVFDLLANVSVSDVRAN